MTTRIAINGLGRIGRCVLRAIAENNIRDIEVVAANGPAPIDTHVHLLKYDSVHGHFGQVTKIDDAHLKVGSNTIKILGERDPEKLPWGDLGVDVVLECTGKFTSKADALKHINAGAKKVLISAPSTDADATIVYGVNNNILKAQDKVISVGSCTTNCLAPVAKVLNDTIGIEKGFMTTVHSYTNDQNIMDNSHKDLRRARAAAMSMIPTSTGAAKALSLVIPELEGRLDGTAIRVPTPNVSMVDLTFISLKNTDAKTINQAMIDAANGSMKGVLQVNDEPLVSIDFTHNPHSSIFDSTGTKVVGGNFCRVVSWYDNEWGFSLRMLDVAKLINSL